MRLGILGPIEIWDDSGTAVSLTPHLRRLLGLLVAAGGSSVSTERIAEHVADRRTDGSVIRTAVSRLRKSLGTRIETTTSGYRCPSNWYRLTVTWHALTANAIAGNPISGAELREPWRWFRDQSLYTLAWHGAVSSAIALDRVGHRDVAERFVWWAPESDPGGVMARFARTLAAAGLDVPESDRSEDLDTLIDEVIALANDLDRTIQ